jgi:hypothetical protein
LALLTACHPAHSAPDQSSITVRLPPVEPSTRELVKQFRHEERICFKAPHASDAHCKALDGLLDRLEKRHLCIINDWFWIDCDMARPYNEETH